MIVTGRVCGFLLLGLLFSAGLGGGDIMSQTLPDSSSLERNKSLHDVIKMAAESNRLPEDLRSYTANVETEITLVLRRPDATEIVGSAEQIASRIRWTQNGAYEQRIIGHRMQQAGAGVSMLSGLRTGWVNPVLYGNRLRTRQSVESDSSGDGLNMITASSSLDTALIVHPLSDDRDEWYTFSGGDTLVVLQAGERHIPIIAVYVEPISQKSDEATLFRGELHIDGSRGTLVRMRGAYMGRSSVMPRGRSVVQRVMSSVVDAVAFVDYQNAERDQKYWLPSTQRIEIQLAAPIFGESRGSMRIVSRISEIDINSSSTESMSSGVSRNNQSSRRLSYAPDDSLTRFDGWQAELGSLSEGLHTDDFDDVGPDRWKPDGDSRLDWGVQQGADLFRFNRIEGFFTGFGARYSFRDRFPGSTIRANVGYAWNENTVRGRVEAAHERGAWRFVLRAGRSLDITNDFRHPMDSGSSFSALAGMDEYDYVGRDHIGVQLQRTVGQRDWQWRLETGFARDAMVENSVSVSPLGGGDFRNNRNVDEGSYWRSAFTLAWRPDGSAEFMRPGLSGRLYAEHGSGELDYSRLEARLAGRREIGSFTAVARADAGVLLGTSLPTQQLFELGRSQGLPGYRYKEFAGTEASVVRAMLMWTGPWYREPFRMLGTAVFPPFAPGFSVGMQSGYTAARSISSQESLNRLGSFTNSDGEILPVSSVSNGWRSSMNIGLRFFSGSFFIGAARALEPREKWHFLVSFGQQL